ncbi:hypothetical protein [Pseudosporangium ferrugineum]|uniref:Uncharacterized protein n=1 Tax=Pseudosporangium ferrugineum TaxID=439699 RepID=A0A2T0RIJ8_9ACTN|nr:hypothetical protein [Pseudosporangium ferrugineum]PRY21005.1 hypothetical protein CLV70_1215 [Pseudosporangium ferrugineum]
MRRGVLFLAVLAGALLVPAAPASAHGGEAPDATAYRIEVTGLSVAAPGLTVRVVEAGARLELTNDTGRTVEVLGYSGEPYLEVRPDGTYQNVNSPAAYTNRTLGGDTPVPSNAGPAAAPQWDRISGDRTVRWHDQRIRWAGADPPPEAAADPSRPHKLRDWSVPLRQGVTTFAATGTLTWEPPPPAWAWWAGAIVLAAGVTAAGLRLRRGIGAVAVVAGTIALAYAVTRTTVGVGGQAPAIGAAAIAVAAGVLTLRGGTPFVLVVGGAALAVFGGLADAGVFTQAVVDFPGPGWAARAAVLFAIGAGAGVGATGALRLRSPAPAPISSDA